MKLGCEYIICQQLNRSSKPHRITVIKTSYMLRQKRERGVGKEHTHFYFVNIVPTPGTMWSPFRTSCALHVTVVLRTSWLFADVLRRSCSSAIHIMLLHRNRCVVRFAIWLLVCVWECFSTTDGMQLSLMLWYGGFEAEFRFTHVCNLFTI